MQLDQDFITRTRARIEAAVIPAMEQYYFHDGVSFGDDFRPGLKHMEKIVSYYDYYACGPSMVYTPLTAGCLYDGLDGMHRRQDQFVRAGDFYRSFLDHDYRLIPLADERTNHAGQACEYGLALHSLSPRGRFYIVDAVDHADFGAFSPEELAVIDHELDLMVPGDCQTPENRTEGNVRIRLPLGIVRKNGFAAGLSALRALNTPPHN
ncbi:MAG: hypothetical protein ABIF71_11805 [Planctomycetota bacterium]